MKIAVNTRFLIKDKLEGIGVFTYEIMKRFCSSYPEIEFIFVFDRKPAPEFIFSSNVKPIIVFPPARHPLLWIIWYEWSLYRQLKKIRPDIFISMDGMLPLRSKIRSVAVIHDLAFETYPEAIPFLVRKYYQFFFPKYAAKADKIITVSGFSKNDIAAKYTIPKEKIEVVYNGSKAIFKKIDEKGKNLITQKYTNGKPFFLYVGSLHPRKNISALLLAFDLFKEKDNADFKLVVAGRKAWKTKEIELCYEKMHFKKDVVFTGWIKDNELSLLTASAFALINVSLFEGFGIPLLDAMNCEIPLIVSKTTSLPEVAGDAALYVNPENIADIAEKMTLLSENLQLRGELIQKAKCEIKKFSWDKSADAFASVVLSLKN